MTSTLRPRRRSARRRATTAAAVGAVLSLALAGCGSDDEPTASDAGGQEASYGEISMQYSWIKNEEFAGEYYAEEKGYYNEAGFDEVDRASPAPTPGSPSS